MERMRNHSRAARRQDIRPAPEETVPEPARSADEPAVSNANVQVIYGASVQELPLGGMRVSEARELALTILQADPRAPVLLNGMPVRLDHLLAPGDSLEFVHHAGEKGAFRGPED